MGYTFRGKLKSARVRSFELGAVNDYSVRFVKGNQHDSVLARLWPYFNAEEERRPRAPRRKVMQQ
jgi:hypothetical protein